VVNCGRKTHNFAPLKMCHFLELYFSRSAETSFERCDDGSLFPFGAHVVVSDDLDAKLHFSSLDGEGFDDCELRWRWDDSVEAEAGGG
jgi:hypothetical protein